MAEASEIVSNQQQQRQQLNDRKQLQKTLERLAIPKNRKIENDNASSGIKSDTSSIDSFKPKKLAFVKQTNGPIKVSKSDHSEAVVTATKHTKTSQATKLQATTPGKKEVEIKKENEIITETCQKEPSNGLNDISDNKKEDLSLPLPSADSNLVNEQMIEITKNQNNEMNETNSVDCVDSETVSNNNSNKEVKTISTEEELYKRKLEEKRREAREKAAKEAELERKRQEELERQEQERLLLEEELQRKSEEEEIRLQEIATRQEEERLR